MPTNLWPKLLQEVNNLNKIGYNIKRRRNKEKLFNCCTLMYYSMDYPLIPKDKDWIALTLFPIGRLHWHVLQCTALHKLLCIRSTAVNSSALCITDGWLVVAEPAGATQPVSGAQRRYIGECSAVQRFVRSCLYYLKSLKVAVKRLEIPISSLGSCDHKNPEVGLPVLDISAHKLYKTYLKLQTNNCTLHIARCTPLHSQFQIGILGGTGCHCAALYRVVECTP